MGLGTGALVAAGDGAGGSSTGVRVGTGVGIAGFLRGIPLASGWPQVESLLLELDQPEKVKAKLPRWHLVSHSGLSHHPAECPLRFGPLPAMPPPQVDYSDPPPK